MDRPNGGNTITLSENSDIDVGARLRAVSYFSLQSYCKRNLSTQVAKMRTRRILREKADCKQSMLELKERYGSLDIPRFLIN